MKYQRKYVIQATPPYSSAASMFTKFFCQTMKSHKSEEI